MRTSLLAAVLLVALASGCGSSDEPDPAASTVDQDAQAVKYSQCMRDNGVPSFPDPVNGRLTINAKKGTDLDPESETYKKAQEACKQYEPAGLAGGGQNGEQQEQTLTWVECMRQNGVPNMPDPQADGRMLVGPDSGVDPESQAYKDAENKCRDLQPGGAG